MPTPRLAVAKTYKQFINGAFPRGESGRSVPVPGPDGLVAHASRASRKDLRDAVEAARAAQPKWAATAAYTRGQILYRLAEMMEARRAELDAALLAGRAPAAARRRAEGETAAAIDRVVCFAGWADKHAHVLAASNPVAGPYYNFTAPEPTGVVAVLAPDQPALLGLISLLAPPLCAGNAVVAVASAANPVPAAVLAECCATADVPAGVVNILLGDAAELAAPIAAHRGIDAVHAAGLAPEGAKTLREGIAENLKRVRVLDRAPDWLDDDACQGPEWIEPFVDMKTVWHPRGL